MTTAVITGAGGFMGRALTARLAARGVAVVGIDSLWAEKLAAPTTALRGDVADAAFVLDALGRHAPDVVFHLAAAKARSASLESYRLAINGTVGTLNIAEACLRTPSVKRLVTMGSCEEYGNSPLPFDERSREAPESAYATAKTTATHLLQALGRTHGLPVTILRPSVVYGPGQGTEMFLPSLINALLSGERFPMSEGRQTRDYVYVDDVVDAMLLAESAQSANGMVLNIASGSSLVLRDLAVQVALLVGPDAQALIDFGKVDYRTTDIMRYEVARDAAHRILNWQPKTGLQEGLAHTIDYYRALQRQKHQNS